MAKIIIGLVGEIAAGKDTVAEYLEQKHKSSTISFSQPLRDILNRLFLEQTRINMATLGDVLRDAFGQDLISKVITEEVKRNRSEVIVLPNIRLESDLIYLSQEPGFVLVGVETDQKIRYERLTQRRQNPDDQTKTWEHFLADSELYTERHIRELIAKAKYRLSNNGSKEELYQQVQQLLTQLQKG